MLQLVGVLPNALDARIYEIGVARFIEHVLLSPIEAIKKTSDGSSRTQMSLFVALFMVFLYFLDSGGDCGESGTRAGFS